jgi:hypothetical protein
MLLTMFLAMILRIRSLSILAPGLGKRLSFVITEMFWGCSSLISRNPVSPGCNLMWSGKSVNVVDSGTAKTVVARGCVFLRSVETITTGRGFLPDGSPGNRAYQICPRRG